MNLISRPVANYNELKQQEESDLIQRISASLKIDDRQKIIKDQLALKEYQDIKQGLRSASNKEQFDFLILNFDQSYRFFGFLSADPNVLPTLTIEDIPKSLPEDKFQLENFGQHSVQWNDQPTNEILFFRSLFPIDQIPEELMNYVPLFCDLFGKMGTPDLSYDQVSQLIDNSTGGIRASWNCLPIVKEHLTSRFISLSDYKH